MSRSRMGHKDRAGFFAMIDTGSSVAAAAVAVGVTKTTGYRWRDARAGIVRRARGWEPGGRALTLADREEISLGLAAGRTPAQIGAVIDRDRSVICREIARNSNRDGSYRAVSAHARAWERMQRPKIAKLVADTQLRAYVVARLAERWSPQQISARLATDFPDRKEMRVSHETIYQAVYVQAKGELRKDLDQALRSGRVHRKPRGRVRGSRSRFPEEILISQRPAEVEDRAVPGHWEGDLIMGARNQSAIGTLVERATRHVLLLHLPKVRDLEGVRDAMITAIGTLPEVMAKSVTWDQGIEMGLHAQITMATDVDIYFCDPHSPWQRGTNENTNGLLRQFFPKGTDLSVHSPDRLREVQDLLNGRPRQTLGWRTPAEAFNELVASAA